MKRYERYKDSGVEWLGEVPEHWEVKRLKYLFSFGKGLNITKENLTKSGFPVINYGQIHSKNNTGTYINKLLIKYISNDYIKSNPQSLVVKGDFIFADTSEDVAGVGNCTYIDSKSSLFAGYHTIILRSLIGDNCKYLAYLFLTNKWRSQLRSRVSGIKVLSITKGILSDNTVVFPPLEEQKKIVKFLDERCAKIDKTLEQKVQMIELLNERRQIIIQRAVTRGLNPNVPLKDSDIDWIGQIPSHWQVKRQKHLTSKIGSGITPSGGSTVYVDYGIPLLRSQNIHFDQIDLTDVAYITDYIDSIMSNSRVCDGDVLLNITGGSIGRCNFIKDLFGRANVNQHVCILRPTAEIKTLMLYYLMRSSLGQHQVEIEQTGGNREGLTFRALKEFRFAIPPIEEQLQITNYLDNVNKKTEKAISLKKQEIEQLKEYKQTLINSAVTGKIKIE